MLINKKVGYFISFGVYNILVLDRSEYLSIKFQINKEIIRKGSVS